MCIDVTRALAAAASDPAAAADSSRATFALLIYIKIQTILKKKS